MVLDIARPVTAKSGSSRARTLKSEFNPKANSLTMLRLGLASLVAMVHAGAVAFGEQPTFGVDPRLGPTHLGDLAVDAFFVLSGFLVTMSYLRLGSPARYLWHRALRILPAFWVCLIFTAVVLAPLITLLEGRPPLSVYPQAFSYIWKNAALHMFDFSVGGAPHTTFTPGVVNGALWTLYYEFVCYLLIAALGVAGFLTRRVRWMPALVIVLGVLNEVAALGLLDLPAQQMRRFFFMFLLGACGLLFAHRIPISGRWALAGLLLVALGLAFLPDYRPVAGVGFAYLCLWAVVALPLRWDPGFDLSYGMYIFHWPIETLLTLLGVAALGVVPFIVIAVLLAAVAAALSWFLVEKPALAHKSRPFPWEEPAIGTR
ncbi:acyltransferase family protein [Gephyromycinifex aptenodytis]|uniref:acyltransferase family protein n=1 Tax=Gephyromycinifex aptenodytis TaxID=2716227 RepID=UPI001445B647|nr:acyltransferase [Gephyromycinifex aptenodytis]